MKNMAISRLLQATLLSVVSVAPAAAAAVEQKFAIKTEFTDFNGGYGSFRETNVDSNLDYGRTALVLGVSQGQRKVDGDRFNAVRLSGTLYHDWTDRFYTRTSLGASQNKPVFARREIAQEINFKLIPRAVLTAGSKYAEYHGGTNVLSWSAGGTYYFGGGLVTYRFSHYNSKNMQSSYGHLVTARLKDPRGKGSTQLWLAAGTALHDAELLPNIDNGNFQSITLQRVQPLTEKFALTVGAGHTRYKIDGSRHSGNSGMLGLTFTP
jgi:YaiO family outer membrane protein